MSYLQVSKSFVVRNTLLNLVGNILPIIIGIIVIPYIISGLGLERFGLLSLAWIILGYFSVLDLGLGQATTKFIAEMLGKKEKEKIPKIMWTTVTIQSILGILMGFIFALITPFLIERILNISSELKKEAETMFYILALSIPVIMTSNAFRGFLEALQRFDLVNIVKIPISISVLILPAIGLFLGFNLPQIIISISVLRVVALIVFAGLSFYIFPKLKTYSVSFSILLSLFSFGVWITISNIVGPILVYVDRFFITSFLSMSDLAYYTAPYEAITRLWIIPTSLVMTLFPAFSTLESSNNKEKLYDLFVSSVKYIFLTLSFIVLFVSLFAEEILNVWLGSNFAQKSTLVLQILALGILINSIAHIPSALLKGIGRADIPAKFHLIELPVYIGIVWLFVEKWGIVGAALAWTFRILLDTFLLFSAVLKVINFSFLTFISKIFGFLSLVCVVFFIIIYGLLPVLSFASKIIFFILSFSLFIWIAWTKVLSVPEKKAILKFIGNKL